MANRFASFSKQLLFRGATFKTTLRRALCAQPPSIKSFVIVDLKMARIHSADPQIYELGVITMKAEEIVPGGVAENSISMSRSRSIRGLTSYQLHTRGMWCVYGDIVADEPLSVVWPRMVEKIAQLPRPICFVAHFGARRTIKALLNELVRCGLPTEGGIVPQIPAHDVFKCSTTPVCRAVDKQRHIAEHGPKVTNPTLKYGLRPTYERVTGNPYPYCVLEETSHYSFGECHQILEIMQAYGPEFTQMVNKKMTPW